MISIYRLILLFVLTIITGQAWSYVSTTDVIRTYDTDRYYYTDRNIEFEVQKLDYDDNKNPFKSLDNFQEIFTNIMPRAVAFVEDFVVTKSVRHGPLNPGSLDAATAATFRSGSYTATTVSETTTLYRVYGGSAGKLGQYWTRTKPTGPIQSQLDSALAPQWGNTTNNVVSIKVPKGTQIFEGAAAPQSTGVGQILGGGNQVYIPRVNSKWIQ